MKSIWTRPAITFLIAILQMTIAVAQENKIYTSLEDASLKKEEVYTLVLSGPELSELPEWIGELKNLKILKIGQDGEGMFSSISMLPESFGQLTSLTELSLYGTEIQNFPMSFSNLTNLELLILHNNPLIDGLPDVIGRFTNLKHLDISGYNYQVAYAPGEDPFANKRSIGLPDSYKNLTKLQNLVLSNLELTELPSFIGNYSELRELKVIDNKLTTLPSSIVNLGQLEYLIASSNSINTLPADIGKLTNLKSLYLDGNYLTSIPESIGDLKNIEELNLSVEGDIFGTGLESESLTTLPSSIVNLKKLISLSLSGNEFTEKEIDKIKKLLPNCEIDFDQF